MNLTTTLLSAAEVADLEIQALPGDLDKIVAIVVTDEAGTTVGRWLFLMVPMAEGMWVHEDYRGDGIKGEVMQKLLTAAGELAAHHGYSRVVTGSNRKGIAKMIKDLGGVPFPADLFILPLGGATMREE